MEMKKGRRGIGFCRSSCVVLVLLCLLPSSRFRERARFSFENSNLKIKENHSAKRQSRRDPTEDILSDSTTTGCLDESTKDNV